MKILIISKYFAPELGIASVRWTKIAKYMHKNYGHQISLITEQRNFTNEDGLILKARKDDMLERDLQNIDHIYEIPLNRSLKIYYLLRNSYRKSKNFDRPSTQVIHDKPNTVKGKIKKEIYLILFDINDLLWGRAAKQYIRKMDLDEYDVIISSYGPFWPHLAGEFLKRHYPKKVWIADFRDPYAGIVDTNISARRHAGISVRHCALADAVLRVNDSMKLAIKRNIPLLKVTNGFDPAEAEKAHDAKRFNMLYTGTMYPKNDIRIIFKVIRELVGEGKMDEEDVRVDFFGTGSDLVRDQVKDARGLDYFADHGLVPRREIIEKQRNAAILIQMSCNSKSEECEWTGKMYEYMMSGKPVIYLVSGDVPYSVPDKNMKRLGGCCYEYCRDTELYPELKKYIYEKYREWKNTGTICITRDEKYVKEFSYPEIAKKMEKIMIRCCASISRKRSV